MAMIHVSLLYWVIFFEDSQLDSAYSTQLSESHELMLTIARKDQSTIL